MIVYAFAAGAATDWRTSRAEADRATALLGGGEVREVEVPPAVGTAVDDISAHVAAELAQTV